MAKMIVNAPSGEQQLIDIGIGGEYFDLSLVVWDERKHGALPGDFIDIGSMVREGHDLVKLPEPLPAHKKWLHEKPIIDTVPDYSKMTLKQLIDLLKTKGMI